MENGFRPLVTGYARIIPGTDTGFTRGNTSGQVWLQIDFVLLLCGWKIWELEQSPVFFMDHVMLRIKTEMGN